MDHRRKRQSIDQKLVASGEKDRLKELLRSKLIESGWREDLKARCKEIVQSRGLDQVTADDLVKELTTYARGKIPDNVKSELQQRIRKFLQDSES